MWWVLAGLGCPLEGRGRTVPAPPDPVAPPLEPVPRLLVTPDRPISGRDDLLCHASDGAEVRWEPADPRVPSPEDGRLPAAVARRSPSWTCTAEGAAPLAVTPEVAATNVLVLLVDDLGRDRLAAFGGTGSGALTPAIDRLVAEGVVFDNAWSEPAGSASRAALLTGRTPRRTGIGDELETRAPAGLDPREVVLPEALRVAGWDDAYFGAWYVGSFFDGPWHPLDTGFAQYWGTLGALDASYLPPPGPLGYFSWEQDDDGLLGFVGGYATARLVEDAERVLPTLREPWFAVVAPNAIGDPAHLPPAAYLRSTAGPPVTPDRTADWMVESVDVAIERVLAVVPDHTTVILLADNGTSPELLEAPYAPSTGEGTTTEAGVNVPMVVAGPLVRRPGSVSRALVQVTDVFDTALAIAGLTGAQVDLGLPEAAARPRDSISFLPSLGDPDRESERRIAFVERFYPEGDGPYALDARAARDARYKLVQLLQLDVVPPVVEAALYDLGEDVVEGENLLLRPLDADEAFALQRLQVVLDGLGDAR